LKLLFDENLSPLLTQRLGDLYPDSSHVELSGLLSADDRDVWDFAREQGFVIVTKDSDFSELSVLRGSPPKVIWLRIGNCTTARAESALRRASSEIGEFLHADEDLLVLAPRG
jgi:predicted nuclease of predicted toxin-antitoxin system